MGKVSACACVRVPPSGVAAAAAALGSHAGLVSKKPPKKMKELRRRRGSDIFHMRSHGEVAARSDPCSVRLKTTLRKERKENTVTLQPDCGNTFVLLSDFVDVCSPEKLVDHSPLKASRFLLT